MIQDKVVAITGASSGIGEATALACAKAGAKVALAARRADRIDALAARIREDGGQAVAIETDVADEAGARAFVEGAREQLGGLHGLVNNAGVMLLGAVEGADTGQWRQMLDVNCLGLLYCTHASIPIMREEGAGHIVNVSSVAGRVASLGSAVYNMTKWGVVGYSESLRQEGALIGVRVTVIEPGFVETELQGHNKNPIVVEQMEKMQKQLPKVLEAKDIANAIVYAASQPEHVSVNEILVRPSGQAR
jgi:NADP-dependent 3-hydroxy acid dehydrogenase YdfG